MRAKTALIALMTGSLLLIAATAGAQGIRTSGSLKGVVTDEVDGSAVVGATVVVSSDALQGTQAEITDSSGQYYIGNLPPGTYLVKVYYNGAEYERPNAVVQLGKTAQVNIRVNSGTGQGEVITLEGRPPVIDQGSTKTGRTITQEFTNNVPTGQTFAGVLGTAAGSQGDLYGQSFGGSTSVENIYIVEGVNTTDPAYGRQSTNLPNEFIQETEVITGGYNAEYGRSTGGIINVVTKSGGNEFSGSVFGYFTPGQLTAEEVATPQLGNAIERNNENAYELSLGAELGGPIIKDKLWFHVGFNPSFFQDDVHRLIMKEDPDTTFLEEVKRDTLNQGGYTMFFTSKLTGAVSPDHQGSVSFLGNPQRYDRYLTVTGRPEAGLVDYDDGAMDVSGKWASKFNNNKTQIDAVLGFHRNVEEYTPADEAIGDGPQLRIDRPHAFTTFADIEQRYYGALPSECAAEEGENSCDVRAYNLGGVGFREEQVTDRLGGSISLTHRLEAAGRHAFKVGLELEDQTYDHTSDFTGGVRYLNRGSVYRIDRWYSRVRDAEMRDGDELCDFGGDELEPCRHMADGLPATTSTQNLGAYVQDSWNILPNLTLNAGVRWERQTLFIADEVKQLTAEMGGDDVAFELDNMVAPRLGIIYDPTQEGRAKLYGHWGRFYESIPMDINSRAFGGEVFNIKFVASDNCDDFIDSDIGEFGCDEADPVFLVNAGGGEEGVVDDLKAQFLDEWILGADYELLSDLKVGASYVHREVGRVIEDVSTDGGTTYIIANPGEGEADIFDTPTRQYDALVITAEKRFSKDLMMQASYTYSKIQGNFPGLFSPETEQLDPNLTSMYDLPELMANRTGPLASDRPHNFKLDGFYTIDAKEAGLFRIGSSVRAVSGIPHNVLGSHPAYGRQESYILPRGAGERSPLTTKFDVQLTYGRKIGTSQQLWLFLQVFNLFNQQPEVDVDEEYTLDDVDPCVGCTDEDLMHVKNVGTGNSARVNPNYGNTSNRQNPLSLTFGMRLNF
jgi:outer membrane receptor protein involved in Fe transport